jgi:hypothetical protein
MLVPALSYKDELEELFAQQLYTKDYFFYSGYPYCGDIPEISTEDNIFNYAIVDGDDLLIGYLSYQIDLLSDTVDNFGLFSFDRGNPIIGIDLANKLEELIELHHRVSWKMIEGNPVKRHYDKFIMKHNGNVAVLHDVTKDDMGIYHNEYIYEIINGGR